MKKSFVTALVLAIPLAGCNAPDDDEKIAQELNVNSRYLVESVHVSGERNVAISDPLRTELEQVAERIKNELHVNEVAIKVSRGTEPNHVVVDFEVTKSHQQDFDLKVAR